MKTDTIIEDKILIDDLQVSAYKFPTPKPESDGTFEWSSTTLVLVTIHAAEHTGLGYTYADGATAYFIRHTLKKYLAGKNVMDIPAITDWLIRKIRNNGQGGIAMMAVSAIDAALWDLKAKIMNLPLCVLLGLARKEVLIYGSGGFTSMTEAELKKQLGEWIDKGIRYVKMKVGRSPELDVQRVASARETIGKEPGLFVDANGGYTRKQALEKAHAFTDYHVTWFEEPVPSEDIEGLKYIRDHAPSSMNITVGEYGYNLQNFQTILSSGATDILQADATRCGGITGFLKAGYLCEAYHLPFSSHCAPALHLHAALSLPAFFIAEYFHDHVLIESTYFEGWNEPADGTLKPDLSRPGLGIEFKFRDAEAFKI